MKRWLETLGGLLDKLLEKVVGEKPPQLVPIRIKSGRQGARSSRRSIINTSFWSISFLITAFIVSGCTRPGKTQTTTLGLSIPTTSKKTVNGKVIAQSVAPEGSTIQHVAININGPGMPGPQVVSWDGHCEGNSSNCQQFPNPFTVSVPSGPNRMIQVLVVFSDSNSGSMTFTYGDAVASLSGGNKSVAIQIAPVGTAGGKQGHVAGQYIDASGTPITGKLIGTYQPPGGKPPMVVTQSEMFGGWLQTFVVEGVGFKYQTDSNQVIFNDLQMASSASNNSLMIDGALISPANHFAHISIPNLWKQEGGMGGWYMRSAQEFFYGWFGGYHSSANRAVCYPTSYNTAYEQDLGGGSHSGIISIDLSVQADSSTIGYGSAIGGLLAGTGATFCDSSNTNFFIDRLDYDPAIAGKDIYRGGGFQGPFKLFANVNYGSPGAVVETYDSATGALTFTWDYLPGVFSGSEPIDGVEIWEKRSAYYQDAYAMGIQEGGNDGGTTFDCAVNLPQKGFSMVRSASGAGDMSHATTYGASEYGVYVLCPYKDGSFFGGRKRFTSVAVLTHSPYSGPALKLRFSSNQATEWNSNFIGTEAHQYVKSKLNSTYYTFSPFTSSGMGSGQCITASDLVSFEVWDDSSGVWHAATNSGTFNGTCQYYDGTALYSAVTAGPWASATQIKLRFKVTSAYQTAQGFNSDTFTTGILNLDSCAPGALQLVYGAAPGTVASLATDLNGQNTDFSRYYRLQYAGCTSAEVPLAANPIQITGAPGCFGFNDIRVDPNHQNEIFVDPADVSETNCALTGTATFYSPNPADNVATSLGGVTLNHSTTQWGIKLYLDENSTPASSMPAAYNLTLDFLMAGPSVPFNFKAWQINSDFKPTGRAAGFVQNPANFNYGSLVSASNWVSMPSSNEVWNSLTGASPLAGNTVYEHKVSNGGGTITTSFGELVSGMNYPITAISDTPSYKGSPVMVVDLGSNNFEIKWIGLNAAGNYVGQSPVTVDTITTDGSSIPKVAASLSMSMNGYNYLFVAYVNASNQVKAKTYVMSQDGMGVVASVTTATVPLINTLADMKLIEQNGNPGGLVIVGYDGTDWNSYYLTARYFDGSSWVGTFDFPGAPTSTLGTAVIPSANQLRLFNCGGVQLMAVGTTGVSPVSPVPISSIGVFGAPLTAGGLLSAGFTIRACATKTWSGGASPMYEFLALHTNSSANYPIIYGFNNSGANSGCGGTANGYMSYVNTTAIPGIDATGTIYGATAFGGEFTIAFKASGSTHQQITRLQTATCSVGSLSGSNTYTNIGGVPTGLQILDIKGSNSMYGTGPSGGQAIDKLSIFGNGGLYMEAAYLK